MAVINFKNLRNNNEQFAWFLFDLIMVILAIINIQLIIFDFTFSYHAVEAFYGKLFPKFTNWYGEKIHDHFILIDLCFVAVFTIEFIVRWIISTYEKDYYRWFFFPFARWYDILGLIPIGSFRILRVLRLVSIVIRLEKMNVLNLRESSFYPFFKKYTDILVEEISDRVVINVLENIQLELNNSKDFTKEMVEQVFKPNNERLVKYAISKIESSGNFLIEQYQDDFKAYIYTKVNSAVENNSEMSTIKFVPGIGSLIHKQIEKAIADITFQVISGMIGDLSKKNEFLTNEIQSVSENVVDHLTKDEELDEIVAVITNNSIEVVKKHVEIQNWKDSM